MGDEKLLDYTPDYAVPPGETILETIEALSMSQAELAERMGRPKKTINEIIKGKSALTPETALQLERVLGVPSNFWSNLERNYRQALASMRERKLLESDIPWLSEFPIRDLMKRGIVRKSTDKIEQLRDILSFFGVSSRESWERIWLEPEGAFRKSSAFSTSPGSVAAWLRMGEIKAQTIECAPYNREGFLSALDEIRYLTSEPPEEFQPRVVKLCAEAGVAVTFLPELPKIRASGYTRWLNPHKALIQLSWRYKTDDHLWFTFFHEAAHILLHGKREVFIEEKGIRNGGEKEDEANRFAANFLVPAQELRRFTRKGKKSKAAIKRFARELGVAPGIVVGRLQHESHLPYSHCNDLKRHFE